MSKIKFPLYKVLILITILAVPGFLYYLLQAKGKNRYKPLSIYGEKQVASTFKTKRGVKIPDTIYHTIPNLKFISVDGDSINFNSLKGDLLIVNFFYSRDSLITPKVNQVISGLNKEFENNKLIKFVSISVDSKVDNVEILKNYAKNIGAKSGKWEILNADSTITYPWIRNQFFVNVLENKEGGFVFSDKFILLDAELRIRGYYVATSFEEIKRLSEELKVLITEELRKIKAEF
jgi:protein SCO1/2